MGVGAYALTSTADAMRYLGKVDSDFREPALAIYNGSGDASAATVSLAYPTLALVVVGGANAGTSNLTLSDANKDTLDELRTAILALSKGWVVNILGSGNASSAWLDDFAATGCLGSTSPETLYYSDKWTLELMIDAVSEAVENLCRRQFVSRDYAGWHSGAGLSSLWLPNPPITRLARLCTGRSDVMWIGNSSTDCTYATVEVTATALRLVVSGGANDDDTALTLGSNSSLTLLAAAVDALGKGWSTSLAGERAYVPASELAIRPSQGATQTMAALSIPDKPVGDYTLEENSGRVRLASRSPKAPNSVYAEYTGGYTTLPNKLVLDVLDCIGAAWDQSKRAAGLRSERFMDRTWVALSARETAERHRRRFATYMRALL